VRQVQGDPETIRVFFFLTSYVRWDRDVTVAELRPETVLRDDLADKGLESGWGGCDFDGFAEHVFGFVEEGDVFAEESDEGLAFFYFVA
jgi:hypothetical protein